MEMKSEKRKNENKKNEVEMLKAMVWILELDEIDSRLVAETAYKIGLNSFFKSYGNLELQDISKEKIRALIDILEAFDGDLDGIDFESERSDA